MYIPHQTAGTGGFRTGKQQERDQMFGEKVPSSEFIIRGEYRDKVLGCWTG